MALAGILAAVLSLPMHQSGYWCGWCVGTFEGATELEVPVHFTYSIYDGQSEWHQGFVEGFYDSPFTIPVPMPPPPD
jgi:hypothetical protein